MKGKLGDLPMLIEVFKLMVLFEWILLVLFILTLSILLYVIKKTSTVDRLVRILSWGQQKRSMVDIRERVLKAGGRLKIAKVNIFISSIIVITSLLGLWYLIKEKYIDVLLPCDFFLLSILAIIPLPFIVLLSEYYTEKVSKKIDELASIEEM